VVERRRTWGGSGQDRQDRAKQSRRGESNTVGWLVGFVSCSGADDPGCRVRIAAAVITPNGKAVRGCAMNLVR